MSNKPLKGIQGRSNGCMCKPRVTQFVKSHRVLEIPDLTESRTPHDCKKRQYNIFSDKRKRVGLRRWLCRTRSQFLWAKRKKKNPLTQFETFGKPKWRLWEWDLLKWLQVLLGIQIQCLVMVHHPLLQKVQAVLELGFNGVEPSLHCNKF